MDKDLLLLRLIIFGGILLLVFLRLYNINYVPSDMEGDCAIYSVISANLAQGRDLREQLPGPDTNVYYYPLLYPLWILLTAFVFRVFDVKMSVLAGLVFLIGVLTLSIFYKYLRQFFTKIIALSTTFLFVTSLWFLPCWYGTGFFPILPFFSLAILFFYYKFKGTNNIRYIFLCSLSLSLALYNGYFHILLLYPVLFIINVLNENGWKRLFNFKLLLIFLLSFAIYFLMLSITCEYIYEINFIDFCKKVYSLIFWRISARSTNSLECIRNNIFWFLKELFYKAGCDENSSFNIYKIIDYPLLSPVVIILFSIGIVFSWIKRDLFSKILNVWLITTIGFYVVVVQPTTRYLVMLAPCFYIFAGLGLNGLYICAKKFNKEKLFSLLLTLIIIFEFTNFNFGYADYFKRNFNLYEYFGMREARKYIEGDCKTVNKGVKVFFQFGEREFHFYTRRRFIGNAAHWGGFNEDFLGDTNNIYYFIFPAPQVEVFGRKSQVFEFQKYFPNLKPVFIVYFNDGSECKYIYRIENF